MAVDVNWTSICLNQHIVDAITRTTVCLQLEALVLTVVKKQGKLLESVTPVQKMKPVGVSGVIGELVLKTVEVALKQGRESA